MKETYRITELLRKPVVWETNLDHRVGKVRAFIFHPTKRQVVGFSVKRPDVALMFHRSDLFVALDSFTEEEGTIIVSKKDASTDKAACKRLGIDLDECVIWQGMSILSESGESCGYVSNVSFRVSDGAVESLIVDRGATSQVLLGTIELPASAIIGFKLGVGEALASGNTEDGDFLHGAIIVSNDVLAYEMQGGVAERAGRASAVAANKVSQAVDKARPVAGDAAHKAGEAVNKGAYALGAQLAKTKGMFASFKEEYRRARHDEDLE